MALSQLLIFYYQFLPGANLGGFLAADGFGLIAHPGKFDDYVTGIIRFQVYHQIVLLVSR
jgi:hypothetical protein